jgi:hypothetical protein
MPIISQNVFPVYSLPTEILERIFDIVFDLNAIDNPYNHPRSPYRLGRQITGGALPAQRIWPVIQEKHMSRLSLFPYCISYVCTTWNEICLDIPKFWTRVFVDVGPRASSILQLKREFEALRNYEITLHISRRDRFVTRDPLERRRVDAFLRIFSAHVHRCQTIRVKTMHRDSLVLLPKHLLSNAPVLKEISACCQSREIVPYKDEIIESAFHAPQMDIMELDPSLFLYHMSGQWLASCSPDPVQSLTILDITSCNNRAIQLSLLDTFQTLGNMLALRSLALTGVRFIPEDLLEPELAEEIEFGSHLTAYISKTFNHMHPRPSFASLQMESNNWNL